MNILSAEDAGAIIAQVGKKGYRRRLILGFLWIVCLLHHHSSSILTRHQCDMRTMNQRIVDSKEQPGNLKFDILPI